MLIKTAAQFDAVKAALESVGFLVPQNSADIDFREPAQLNVGLAYSVDVVQTVASAIASNSDS